MDAAEAWGVPPWKIAGGSKVKWYARFAAWREEKIKHTARLNAKIKRDAEAARTNRYK